MSKIKIINDDCFNVLPNIKDNTIDLVLTDPPYCISQNGSTFDNAPDKTEYISIYKKYVTDQGEWDKISLPLEPLMSQLYRIIKPGGTVIIWFDIWKLESLRNAAELAGFVQPRIGSWVKTNPVPVNSKINYLNNAREYFASFCKVGKPTFNSSYDTGDYIQSYSDEDSYYHSIVHGAERTAHPTQKPLEVFKELIRKHSNVGDTVIDPFGGSGTTAVACKMLDRNCILVEKDKKFTDICNDRVKKNIS